MCLCGEERLGRRNSGGSSPEASFLKEGAEREGRGDEVGEAVEGFYLGRNWKPPGGLSGAMTRSCQALGASSGSGSGAVVGMGTAGCQDAGGAMILAKMLVAQSRQYRDRGGRPPNAREGQGNKICRES